jgi:hypothetical protein
VHPATVSGRICYSQPRRYFRPQISIVNHLALPFAIRNVSFHLVDVDFPDGIAVFVCVLIWPVHVNVHDVFGDELE